MQRLSKGAIKRSSAMAHDHHFLSRLSKYHIDFFADDPFSPFHLTASTLRDSPINSIEFNSDVILN
jgi:hypothetical protein